MGKAVGGGSSINATIWARSFRNDLEHWANEAGDKAWGYEHGLSIYRRMVPPIGVVHASSAYRVQLPNLIAAAMIRP